MSIKSKLCQKNLTLVKPTKKSKFKSEDDDSSTPLSNQSTRNKLDFQTDDSETNSPVTPSPKQAQSPQYSKFKPKQTVVQQLFTKTAKQVLEQKHAQSDAELKKLTNKKTELDNHPFRHLIFGENTTEKCLFKHLQLIQRGLIYATKCLKLPSLDYVKSREIDIPREEEKSKILLLDLDETLIHCCVGKEIPQVKIDEIGFNVRPYTKYLLQTLSQYYSIYIFTASSPAYATIIVDYLDPDSQYIVGIFSRSHCMETKNGFFIKDLRTLKGVDLSQTLIVDNLAHSFGFQIDNGIPILEWFNDQNDTELKQLTNYLIQASKADDVRQFNKQYLRLHELLDYPL